jgi:hypothetical protein
MGGSFTLEATDGTTHTQTTTFTDKTIGITFDNFSPTSCIAGSTEVYFSLDITCDSPASSYLPVKQVEISMPAIDGSDWGTPVLDGISGVDDWEVDTANTGPGQLTIYMTGPTNDALDPGETMTLSFTVDAPAETDTSTWSIIGYGNVGSGGGNSDTQTQDVDVMPLEVDKTVETYFNRTYSWTIDKYAAVSSLNLDIDETQSVHYTIDVNADYDENDDVYWINGTITIHNPSDAPVNITALTDITDEVELISDSTVVSATVYSEDTFPYEIGPSEDLEVTYSAVLTDDEWSNTATVAVGEASFESDPVTFDFESATMIEVDKCITVSDTYTGTGSPQNAEVCFDDLPKSFGYDRTIGSYSTGGTYTVSNTASFVTNDQGLTDSDTFTLTVYVEGSSFCAITSKGFQEIDTFKLIFTPDMPDNPGYSRLTASNPGQFSFNVFLGPHAGATVTLTIPYPFVTQAANPVHIYTATSYWNPDGEDITYLFDLSDSGTPWLMSDWDDNTFGATHVITIHVPADYEDSLYITIHLDYGLKKMAGGYSANLVAGDHYLDAVATAGSAYDTIENDYPYTFSVTGPVSGSDTFNNLNVFKNDPGIGGLVLDEFGNPLQNEKVEVFQGKNSYGTAYTDEDGWYMVNFKYTGKPTTFTIKADGYPDQTVTIRSNSFTVVSFDKSAAVENTESTIQEPPSSPASPTGKGKK